MTVVTAAARVAIVTAVAGLLLTGAASPASAHASVVATTPGDGTVLTTGPATVAVSFDQPVTAGTGALRVLAPDGHRVDSGSPFHPAGRGSDLAVTLGDRSERGTYTVAWRVVSSDSHPVSGGFTFSIGIATTVTSPDAAGQPTGSRTVGVLFGIARWTAYTGYAALVGGTTFATWCWPAGSALRSTRRMLTAAWATTVAGTLGCLLAQGPYGAGLGLGTATSWPVLSQTLATRLGTAVLVRLALLVAAVPVLILLLQRRHRPATGTLASLMATALSVTWVAADHGGSGEQVEIAVPVSALHLLATAIWLGGVAFLAMVALREGSSAARVRADEESASKPESGPGLEAGSGLDSSTGAGFGSDLEAGVKRFSRLALACIIVLLASGLYDSWRGVGTWAALIGTAYGRLIIGKTAGFALVLCLGATARRALARRALPSLRDTVVVETGVGLGVLALAAVLVEVQPGRTAYAPPVHATAAFDTGGPHGAGTAQLVVDPARTGFATFDLAIVDPARSPVREAEVSAALQLDAQRLGPLPVTFTDVGTGRYRATASIAVPGAWVLRVTVRSDALNETTVAFPVKVH
ncbi:copper resistance protein CopC [Catenulispora yoronensis]|uniref:copper resistance CopC/CopD family protein n=1 Tax=Catenulispora yoronensis TaxID=450799 RepID=UPI0031CE5143